MTNEPINLDAAQALANAATPGPWSVEYEVNHWEDFGNTPGEKFPYAIAGPDVMGGGSASGISEISTADVEFIAQARTLVPALIARVRDLEVINKSLSNAHGFRLREMDQMHATIARVKELADETPAGIYGDYGPPVVLASAIYDALEGEKS